MIICKFRNKKLLLRFELKNKQGDEICRYKKRHRFSQDIWK